MTAISVIIPFYKVPENLFRRCLSALRAQTFGDLELIFVDDCSPQKELSEILSSCQDPRIRLFTHPENRGVSAARNTGLEHASGEYIAFADADDFMEPDTCEKLYRAVRNGSADMSVCLFDRIDSAGQPLPHRHIDSIRLPDRVLELDDPGLASIFSCMQWSVWNKLFRKSCLRTPFPEGFAVSEDKYFCIMNLLSCNRVSFVPERLYHYVCSASSVTLSRKSVHLQQALAMNGQILKIIAEKADTRPFFSRKAALDYLRSLITDYMENPLGLPAASRESVIREAWEENGPFLRKFLPPILRLYPFFLRVSHFPLFCRSALVWRWLIRSANGALDRKLKNIRGPAA